MKKTIALLTILFALGADSAVADTIELRNGRVIHGKVLSKLPATGPIKGPITVSFTGGGSLVLEPGKVLRVRRDSSCDFKLRPAKPDGKKLPDKRESPGKKTGGGPVKPEEKKPTGKKAEETKKSVDAVEPKLEAEIRGYVSELSRQRSQNRVRAEAALKRLGPVTIPYLEEAARHPFALTRRAVIRIVAGTKDARGEKLLRAALKDEDSWVRKLAHEALSR